MLRYAYARMKKVGARGVWSRAIVFLLGVCLSNANWADEVQNPRPVFYYFENGASVSIHGDEVAFTPPPGEDRIHGFRQAKGISNVVFIPEGIPENEKNTGTTTLTKEVDGRIVLRSEPKAAIPILWKTNDGQQKIAFITKDGKIIRFRDAHTQSKQAQPKHLDIKAFSYNIFSIPKGLGYNSDSPDDGYYILATVSVKAESLITATARPWLVSSYGLNEYIHTDTKLNYYAQYDPQMHSFLMEYKAEDADNRLIRIVANQRSTTVTFEDPDDHPSWKNGGHTRPLLSYSANAREEWMSHSHQSIQNLHSGDNVTDLITKSPRSTISNVTVTNDPNLLGKAQPRTKVNKPMLTSGGKEMNLDSVMATFSKRYSLSQIPDLKFNREDFRPIAISTLANPAQSVVVTGESGGGKSTFVKGFVRAILNGEYLDKGIDPKNTEIIRFSALSLDSGTSNRGDYELKMDALIKYAEWALKSGIRVIYIVDEIHALNGSGTSQGSPNDGIHALLEPLGEGVLTIIGMTTSENYMQIASRPDAARRLPAWPLPVTPIEEIPTKLKNWIEAYGKPEVSDDFLRHLTDLAIEFDSNGEPLSRASRLLQRIYTEAAYDNLTMSEVEANSQYVLEAASRFYGYNVANFSMDGLDDKLDAMDEKLSHIVGYDNIKEKVKAYYISTVTRSRIADKVGGRLLFISPPGLGKSTLNKAIADALGRPYVRIALSAYTDREMLYSDVARAILKNPFSHIFFDELGDAPRDIIAALNSLLDDNRISADINYGKANADHTKVTVYLDRAYVTAATNSGSTYIDDFMKGKTQGTELGFAAMTSPEKVATWEVAKLKARAAEEGLFASLIDRFELVPVMYYDREHFRAILRTNFDRGLEIIRKRRNVSLYVSQERKDRVIEKLMTEHYSETASPRAAIEDMANIIESYSSFLYVEKDSPKAASVLRHNCKLLLGE